MHQINILHTFNLHNVMSFISIKQINEGINRNRNTSGSVILIKFSQFPFIAFVFKFIRKNRTVTKNECMRNKGFIFIYIFHNWSKTYCVSSPVWTWEPKESGSHFRENNHLIRIRIYLHNYVNSSPNIEQSRQPNFLWCWHTSSVRKYHQQRKKDLPWQETTYRKLLQDIWTSHILAGSSLRTDNGKTLLWLLQSHVQFLQ